MKASEAVVIFMGGSLMGAFVGLFGYLFVVEDGLFPAMMLFILAVLHIVCVFTLKGKYDA